MSVPPVAAYDRLIYTATAVLGGVLLFSVGCKKQVKTASENEAPVAIPVVEIAEEKIAPPATVVEAAIDPEIPALKVNKAAQIAILCYHDFVTNRAATQMRIGVDHFRKQMQAIKDARLPVITLSDFVKWRHGEKDIPDSSLMITIDDGYNSIYLEAYPILKEYGFPFTVFLYQQYVNGGGRALTTAMVQEMLANGCELGSHSVSHPLNIARVGSRTPEEYETFLVRELQQSKLFLEDLFMRPVPTYAHPGGTYTQHILELGSSFGYEFMFSVNPAKVTWESAPGTIPRYVVLGNDANDRNFHAALSFRGISEGDLGRQLLGENEAGGEALVSTAPKPNATIASRRPLISVDVSKLESIDPASVTMKIAGFGQVPCQYDPRTGQITCQVMEPLRSNEVHVHVSFQRQGNDKPDMVSWKFFIDLIAHYLPEPPITVEAPKAVQIMEADPETPEDSAIPPPTAPAPKEKPAAKKPKRPGHR